MPQQTDQASLAGYSGDETINRLRVNAQGGVLNIKSELPFRPGQSLGFDGGSYNVFGDGVLITGGSVHIVGRSRQRMLIVNGREVDLSRHIQFALIVSVGTGPTLGGALDFSACLCL